MNVDPQAAASITERRPPFLFRKHKVVVAGASLSPGVAGRGWTTLLQATRLNHIASRRDLVVAELGADSEWMAFQDLPEGLELSGNGAPRGCGSTVRADLWGAS